MVAVSVKPSKSAATAKKKIEKSATATKVTTSKVYYKNVYYTEGEKVVPAPKKNAKTTETKRREAEKREEKVRKEREEEEQQKARARLCEEVDVQRAEAAPAIKKVEKRAAGPEKKQRKASRTEKAPTNEQPEMDAPENEVTQMDKPEIEEQASVSKKKQTKTEIKRMEAEKREENMRKEREDEEEQRAKARLLEESNRQCAETVQATKKVEKSVPAPEKKQKKARGAGKVVAASRKTQAREPCTTAEPETGAPDIEVGVVERHDSLENEVRETDAPENEAPEMEDMEPPVWGSPPRAGAAPKKPETVEKKITSASLPKTAGKKPETVEKKITSASLPQTAGKITAASLPKTAGKTCTENVEKNIASSSMPDNLAKAAAVIASQDFTPKLDANGMPEKPKKAVSAYMLFCHSHREEVTNEYKESGKPSWGLLPEVAKVLSSRWQALGDEEKAKYDRVAAEGRSKQEESMKAYREATDPLGCLKKKYEHMIPKKPTTAFFHFSADESQRQKAIRTLMLWGPPLEKVSSHGSGGGDSVPANHIASKLADMWRALNAEGKAQYELMHDREKAAYDSKLKAWESTPEFAELHQLEKAQQESNQAEKKKEKDAEKAKKAEQKEAEKAERREQKEAEKNEKRAQKRAQKEADGNANEAPPPAKRGRARTKACVTQAGGA